MEPNSVRISHAQTTPPTRIKAGKPIICFNAIGMCESKDFIEADDGGEIPKEEHSLVFQASEILERLGARVNLTLAAGGERYGSFPLRGRGCAADPIP